MDQILHRYVAVLVNKSHVDDVVQETWLALTKYPHRLIYIGAGSDPQRAMTRYVRVVAKSKARNLLRGLRLDAATRASLAAVLTQEDLELPDANALCLDPDARDLIHSGLASLRPRDRRLMLLRLAGWSYAAIGQALSMSPTAVGAALSRAHQALSAVVRALLS
ncbi:MAG: sigma-70 family RNA polymerase sigma factor [Phycisphaerae bacterium]|nr:sigma-70 family RNA polymerase sigma factor [Phycisphaerae bacterium]